MAVHDIKIYNEEESGSLKSIKRENEFHVECVLSTNIIPRVNLAFVLKYLFSAVKACNISLTLKDDKDTREE